MKYLRVLVLFLHFLLSESRMVSSDDVNCKSIIEYYARHNYFVQDCLKTDCSNEEKCAFYWKIENETDQGLAESMCGWIESSHLTSVNNVEESVLVDQFRHISNAENMWIGMHINKSDCEPYWFDGTPTTYNFWKLSSPKRCDASACVVHHYSVSENGKKGWFQQDCYNKYKSLCKYAPQ